MNAVMCGFCHLEIITKTIAFLEDENGKEQRICVSCVMKYDYDVPDEEEEDGK
jgi:hypothetical protein